MTPVAGTLLANRFQLVRELGSGTMGTVWLANHLTLGLRCAVKFMTAEATRDPNYRARFELEARAVAQLHSPNVVRVLDYDVWEGVPFIAMEWLPGEDLEARRLRVGRLDAASVHRIVTQVAQGLTRAHAAGIIHRDLKPANVFLALEDDHEVAKLLDFGIAKVTSFDGVGSGTQAGSVLGTPAYMSPEQARGVLEIDYRSDLWSLGVIAYECLVGQLPFDGPALGDVFAKIMFEPIPVPSEVAPDLPPAFDRWWERAVSRDVEGRFSSARELADELGRALGLGDARWSNADLSAARSLEPPPRLPRRRWPGVVAAAILALVIVVPAVRFQSYVTGVAPGEVPGRVSNAAHALARTVTDLAESAGVEAPKAPALVAPPPSAPPAESLTPLPAPRPASPVAMNPAPAMPDAPAPSAAPAPQLARNGVAPGPGDAVTRPAEGTASKGPAVAPAPAARIAPPARTAITAGSQTAGARPRDKVLPPTLPPPPAVTSSEQPLPPGAECGAGQHRCRGRTLQVCDDARDGWADVTECGAETTCDATGEGRCIPSGGSDTNPPSGPVEEQVP